MTMRNLCSMAALGLLLALAAPTMAQAPGGGGPPGGGQPGGGPGGGQPGGGPGGGRPDFDQMRKQMTEKMRDLVGATPEEWTVLQPRIEKVQTLQRDQTTSSFRGYALLMGGGNSDRFRSRTPRSGDPNAAPAQPSLLEQKAKDLQTSVENKETSPEELKMRLAAIRDAKARAKADLARNQEELRQLLTVRQEAVLVMLGVLE